MPDETASTIVVGRAYVKHRFSRTDGIASDDSHEIADFRLLREHEHRQRSQLPNGHGGDDFSFCIVMLHDSIGMLRTLLY
jgi:hypothetical protein